MKARLSALSVGVALMVMGTSASAVPFSYRFEATATNASGLPAGAGEPEFDWSINGFNPVLISDTVELRLETVGGTIEPENWTLVTQAVPMSLPSTLLLLVGLGGVALLCRGSPATTGAFAEARDA